MTDRQLDTWKKVRTVGTVNLVIGIIWLVFTLLAILGSLVLIIANFSIPNDSGPPTPSNVVGIILIVITIIFLLPFAILNIISGIKLRKPIANPKGWLIYTIVVGVIGIQSITGIIQLIFGILALGTLSDIEGTQPPEKIS
jgi:hypothetical protein